MRKILYIAITLVLTGTVSCKKFLEEENPAGLTNETYYVDAAGFDALVSSCYASLKNVYSPNPSLFEWGTDITTRGEIELVSGAANIVPATQLNEYKTLAADNPDVSSFFTRIYSGIQRCNTGINAAGKIPGLIESLKSRRIAELRFIRAYYYYLLVENFGGVPIVQEEISTPITHFERNTEQQVYDFMFAELNTALPNLEGDPSKVEPGRVTQGAVKHLLSLLYLTRGYKSFGSAADFTESAKLAEELISSPHYTLLPSFADVFKTGNEQNKEIIFSVQYEAQPGGAGHGQNILFGWRIWREQGVDEVSGLKEYNRRRSDFSPTPFLYSLYQTSKDKRYDVTFRSQYQAVKNQGAIQTGNLLFHFPYHDETYTTAQEAALKLSNPNVQVIRYPYVYTYGAEKYPMINKFYDPNAALPGSFDQLYAGTKDIFLFRLAETYLIAAEAYFKLGLLDKAKDKLNSLRDRAEKAPGQLDITAADVTLDFILDERARELAGEYKRWLDLKRTRSLGRVFQHNELAKAANGTTVDNKYYLRPIPQSVRDRDTGVFPQNDGY